MHSRSTDGTPPRRGFGWADLLSAVRFPLAAAFAWHDDTPIRLALVALAALSDLADGPVARRQGPTRIGAVLDPVADKAFTVTAFVTVAVEHAGKSIAAWELALVLLRDVAAVGGLVAVLLLRRPVTVPARFWGKAVTVLQFASLFAVLVESPLTRALIVATAAVSVVAVADYAVAARALLRPRGPAGR